MWNREEERRGIVEIFFNSRLGDGLCLARSLTKTRNMKYRNNLKLPCKFPGPDRQLPTSGRVKFTDNPCIRAFRPTRRASSVSSQAMPGILTPDEHGVPRIRDDGADHVVTDLFGPVHALKKMEERKMPAKFNKDGVIINAEDLTVLEVVQRRVLCPCCHSMFFEKWPLGWDAHAASRCRGAESDTDRERKIYFRERFARLFR
jgi:hypothetical protein